MSEHQRQQHMDEDKLQHAVQHVDSEGDERDALVSPGRSFIA
jgi:hypothetical protein